MCHSTAESPENLGACEHLRVSEDEGALLQIQINFILPFLGLATSLT